MKKVLLSLLAGTLVFSGCSFGGEEKPTPVATPQETIAPEAAKKEAEESPEDLFYTLAQANLDYSVAVLQETFPSKAAFTKGEKTLSAAGTISLEGTPAQTGNVSFDVSAAAQSDFSDTENTQVSHTLTFTGDIKDSFVSGSVHGSAEVRVVDNALFASLSSLTIDSPFIPQEQVEAMAGPLIGKWFGNTFEELNALQGNGPKLDLQKFIAGTPMGVLIWEVIEDGQANLKDYVEFVALKEEKDGIYYFEAKAKSEKLVEFGEKFADAFGLPAQVAAEMKKAIEAQKNEVITIGYKASDSSFITAESVAVDLDTQEKIEGKTNSVTLSDTEFALEIYLEENEVLRIQAKDGKFTIGGDSEEKTGFTVVNGTYSDTTFTFEAADIEEGSQKVSGNFTKTGDVWAGEITNTMDASVVLEISNASYSKEKMTLSLGVKVGELVYGPVAFEATMKEVADVSVEKPADAQPFESIQALLVPQQAPAADIEAEVLEVSAEGAEAQEVVEKSAY